MGVRLAVSSEVEEGQRWAESRLKALTGDASLTGRYMRQDFFEFRRTHKLMVAGNHRPAIRVVDEAMRRRIHLVPSRRGSRATQPTATCPRSSAPKRWRARLDGPWVPRLAGRRPTAAPCCARAPRRTTSPPRTRSGSGWPSAATPATPPPRRRAGALRLYKQWKESEASERPPPSGSRSSWNSGSQRNGGVGLLDSKGSPSRGLRDRQAGQAGSPVRHVMRARA